MRIDVILIAAGVLALSAVLSGVVLRLASQRGMLDLPNERSSHAAPTPRGGGVAIVIASGLGLMLLWATGEAQPALIVALLGGGGAVAVVGFVDDRRGTSARTRLLIHAGAALFALMVLGGLPPIQIGEHAVQLGWSGYVLGAVAIVWVLNLFNFMDGIDGVAAAEAVFVLAVGTYLCGVSTGNAAIMVVAACLGFLLWNWAPARIFMGDIGSGYLGYAIAVIAIACGNHNPTAVPCWLILGGFFFCDATVTLVRRLIRRDRVYQAHRTHAYQWLARRWRSHSRVALTVMAVNLFWLLPCAVFAALHPRLAAWAVLAALVPVALLVLFTGAGRAET
jgi:Fuc2NAc and GlcNAc transferase